MSQPHSKKRKTIKDEVISPKKPQAPPLKAQQSRSISVAIPTSIISQCSNLQQATACIYQVARALCIYNVSEVVVLDVTEARAEAKVTAAALPAQKKKIVFGDEEPASVGNESKTAAEDVLGNEVMLIASLLQFFITPPYLVKASFTKAQLPFFKYAFKLPKISTLPFMLNNSTQYKEGLSIPKKKTKQNLTKHINIGSSKAFQIDQEIPANVRVTVDTKTHKIVSPREAYGITGASSAFGYHVRISKAFNAVFTESAWPQGYTKTVYCNSGEFFSNQLERSKAYVLSKDIVVGDGDKTLLLIGEYARLEKSFQSDDKLKDLNSFKQMCDFELEIVQGCRIEDGLLIALTKLDVY